MAITVETRTDIIELIVGMVGAAPGATILSELADIVDAGTSLNDLAIALANNPAFKVLYPSFLTNTEFATNFLTELMGSEVDATTLSTSVDAMVADLNSGTHRGAAMYTAIKTLGDTAETDANFGAAAAALNNKTEVAVAYSVTTQQSAETLDALQAVVKDVTSSEATVTAALAEVNGEAAAGTTFNLTTGVDNITGSTKNDTINAFVDAAASATSTFTAADVIAGGSGTDVLSLTASGATANGLPAATITDVESYIIRDVGNTAGGSYNFAIVSGETSVTSKASTNAAGVTFTGLATGAAVTLQGDGTSTIANHTLGFQTASAPLTLTFDGGYRTGTVTRAQTGSTVLTINSTGAANTTGALDLDTATALKTVTFNATTDLTATLTADFAASTTFTIAGAASKVDLDAAALSANVKTIDASGLTAGGARIAVDQTDATVDTQFTGGTGSDMLNIGKVVYSSATLTADGGAGTDTLVVNDQAAITTATAKNISNFEVLSLTDDNDAALDTFNASTLTGITTITIAADSAGDGYAVTGLTSAQAANITFTGTQAVAPTLTLTGATQVGQLDTLGITIFDGLAAAAAYTMAGLTAAGVETINITSNEGFTLSSATGLGAMTNLNLKGAGTASVTTGALALNVNTLVTATETVTATFNAAAATGNPFGYTGNDKVDTVTDNAVGGNVITTGGGKDVITLTTKTSGTSGVVITGGAAADALTITGAEGNDADEVITLKFAAGDSITDTNAATGNATTGLSSSVTDTITGVDFATTAASGAGHRITFDTEVSATAVTFSSTAPTFGTTTVTNANDFYVYNTGAGGITFIYQDTDGDKIIESGEFGIQLTGAAATVTTAGEFAISGGNLVLTTVA